MRWFRAMPGHGSQRNRFVPQPQASVFAGGAAAALAGAGAVALVLAAALAALSVRRRKTGKHTPREETEGTGGVALVPPPELRCM